MADLSRLLTQARLQISQQRIPALIYPPKALLLQQVIISASVMTQDMADRQTTTVLIHGYGISMNGHLMR